MPAPIRTAKPARIGNFSATGALDISGGPALLNADRAMVRNYVGVGSISGAVPKFQGNKASLPLIENIPEAIPFVSPQVIVNLGNSLAEGAITIADKENTFRASNKLIAYNERMRDVLYNTDNGFMYTESIETMDSFSPTVEKMQGIRNEMLENMEPAVRAKALADMMSTEDQYIDIMSRYRVQQSKVYQEQSEQAMVDEVQKQVMLYNTSPDEFFPKMAEKTAALFPNWQTDPRQQNMKSGLESKLTAAAIDEIVNRVPPKPIFTKNSPDVARERYQPVIDEVQTYLNAGKAYFGILEMPQQEAKLVTLKNQMQAATEQALEDERKTKRITAENLSKAMVQAGRDGMSEDEVTATLDYALEQDHITGMEYGQLYGAYKAAKKNSEEYLGPGTADEHMRNLDGAGSDDEQTQAEASQSLMYIRQFGTEKERIKAENKFAIHAHAVLDVPTRHANNYIENTIARTAAGSFIGNTSYQGSLQELETKNTIQSMQGVLYSKMRQAVTNEINNPQDPLPSPMEIANQLISEYNETLVEGTLVDDSGKKIAAASMTPDQVKDAIDRINAIQGPLTGSSQKIKNELYTIGEVHAVQAQEQKDAAEEEIRTRPKPEATPIIQDIPAEDQPAAEKEQAMQTLGGFGAGGSEMFSEGTEARATQAMGSKYPEGERDPVFSPDPEQNEAILRESYMLFTRPYTNINDIDARRSELIAIPPPAPKLTQTGEAVLVDPDTQWEVPEVREAAIRRNYAMGHPGYILQGVNDILAMGFDMLGDTPYITMRQILSRFGRVIESSVSEAGEVREGAVEKTMESFDMLIGGIENGLFTDPGGIPFFQDTLEQIW